MRGLGVPVVTLACALAFVAAIPLMPSITYSRAAFTVPFDR